MSGGGNQKMPRAVVKAKTRKSEPAINPTTFSLMYLAMYDPPATAMRVAAAWAAMAPVATLTGFCAAPKAIVERNERSPNSAAKTRPKVLAMLDQRVDMSPV